MKKKGIMLFSLFLILSVLSFSALAEPEFEEVKAQQVKKILDSGEQVFLLNGVSDIMFNQGFIPGSVNVVLEDIATSDLMPEDLDTLIISYCMGRR